MPPRRTPVARVPDDVQEEVAQKAADMRKEAQEVFEDDIVKGVYGKLAHILRTMPEMKPEGKNPHFRYQYWSTDQVTGFFRARFGELGLALMVDVEEINILEGKTAKGGSTWLTTLKVRFTITDSETGETVSGCGVGQGDDPGDKGANKAMTGALKYWLMKVGLMGGEDPEADEATDKRSEARASGAAAPSVKVGESKIEGIRRGGRANKATDVQVRQVRVLAGDLGWNSSKAATQIGTILGDEIELTEGDEGPSLVKYLEGLDSDDIGKVITAMAEAKDKLEAPDDAEPREDFDDLPY
jgi:hypothetical protein